jgi:hypothetical protein
MLLPNVALIATCFRATFCSAYSSTLEMETIHSSETSVDFQRTTLSYIPQDRTLLFMEVNQNLIELSTNFTKSLETEIP